MSEANVVKNHIVRDQMFDGWARLAGHRIRVMDIVLSYLDCNSVEAVLQDYPQLTHGQVHAALAYYYDHRLEIEDQIKRSEEEWQSGAAAQTLHPKLRAGLENKLPKK